MAEKASLSIIGILDDYKLALRLGFRMNPLFIGRHGSLWQLEEALSQGTASNAGPLVVVVIGTGGVGKTQLVRQYAYTHQSQFSSISWINCTTKETIMLSFHELAQRVVSHYCDHNCDAVPPHDHLARHLHMSGLIDTDGQVIFSHKTNKSMVEAVKRWLCGAENSDWLLIFDNADDLETVNISELFPDANHGRIVITSRRPEAGQWGDELHLNVFDEAESIDLLERRCRYKRSFSERGMSKISFFMLRWVKLTCICNRARRSQEDCAPPRMPALSH